MQKAIRIHAGRGAGRGGPGRAILLGAAVSLGVLAAALTLLTVLTERGVIPMTGLRIPALCALGPAFGFGSFLTARQTERAKLPCALAASAAGFLILLAAFAEGKGTADCSLGAACGIAAVSSLLGCLVGVRRKRYGGY